MKRHLLSAPGLFVLLAATPARAITYTWDGGSLTDSNISTPANWNPDGAPVSNTASTSLIFGGTARLTPNFSVPFSAFDVTFNNTAGAFTFGGTTLTLGGGGVTNNDADPQTFNNPTTIFGPTSTFNAASGALVFNGSIALGVNPLTLSGANAITLGSITGTGTITKSGAGALTINSSATPLAADLVLNLGTTTLAATGTPLTVAATGSVQVGVTALNLNESVVFDGGAQLSRGSTGSVTVAAGKTLTFQGGSDAIISGNFAQGGGNLLITGAGSAFGTTSGGTLTVPANGTASVLAGGTLLCTGGVNVASASGGGTLLVDGAGTTVSAGTSSTWGASGNDAAVTFSNNAAATLAAVSIASTSGAGISATVDVLTGADVSSNNLNIASVVSAHVATVTVDGIGSSWLQNGASTLTIGANLTESGTLEVRNYATFFSGTGLTTIHPTGTLAITGGSYTANGNFTVNGGKFTRNDTGSFILAPGKTLTVQNGGGANFTGLLNASGMDSAALVTGAGSTLNVTDILSTGSSFDLNVLGGGTVTAGAYNAGFTNFADTASISGSGSSLNIGAGTVQFGNVDFSFRNGSTGTMGVVKVNPEMFGLAGAVADVAVESGADVTSGTVHLGNGVDSGTGNQSRLTVTGAGSTWSQTGNAALNIGSSVADASPGELNVAAGGAYSSGTGSVSLQTSGTINLDGGTLSLNGPLTDNGGTVNFTGGALNMVSNFRIGVGGLLGDGDQIFTASRRFATTGVTTIDAFQTLTLDGGRFATGALTNNGILDFQSGTLGITGAGGFNIGTGALGASVTLRDGARLEVTNTTTVNAGATLRFDGGNITTGLIDTFGTVRVDRGTVTPDVVFVRGGGRLFVADTLAYAVNANHAIVTNGRLTLEGGALVTGQGVIGSDGLITGDGTITLFVGSTGEVRAEAGKTLYFTGGTGAHNGRCNLQGGTLFFTQPFTNDTAGQFNGHGELYFPDTPVPASGAPAAGLNNSGSMNLSGGDSLIFGTVAVNGPGKVIASGGATATFFDVFRHAGAEVKASTGSALVFFSEVRGPGSFTGTGTVYMEGGYSPGASPASVSLAPQMVFTESNVLTMELGGTTAGTQHDKLTFTSAAATQVQWGGTLKVELINDFTPAPGHSFDLFDFDAARDAGTFTTLTLPTLPAGLLWDTTELYTTGTIRIVPDGLTFAAWATASGIPGALPGGDHDSDGYDNATEFALGLFPPQLGTVEPAGGFFTYAEGERLRILFTRPLDRTGVTLRIQASTNLTNWTDLAVSVDSAPFTGAGFVSENRAHLLNEPGLVEVRDILTAATAPRRQIRLLIIIAP